MVKLEHIYQLVYHGLVCQTGLGWGKESVGKVGLGQESVGKVGLGQESGGKAGWGQESGGKVGWGQESGGKVCLNTYFVLLHAARSKMQYW